MLDTIVELAVIVGFILISGALVVAGVAIELIAAANLIGGDVYLGLWEGAIGLILLYAGIYAVGYHEVYPRLRAVIT